MVELNRYKFFIGKKLFERRFRQVADRLTGPVLDVGGGSAPFRRMLKTQSIFRMDIEPALHPDVAARAEQIPFQNSIFSSVICTEVLEHVPDPARCLSEMRRTLKPGGRLYLTAPMLWPLHYEPNDYYRYTPYGLKHLLVKTGFRVDEIVAVGGLFSFVSMRVGEKAFNLVHKLAFFLPKHLRWIFSVPLTLPVFYVMYLLSFVIDPLMKKDVFSWSVLATAVEPS